MGRLQRHSEACFVNDLLRDAADRLATSKSSAEEVERGAPTTESDPVEARELSAVAFFFSEVPGDNGSSRKRNRSVFPTMD